MVTDGALVELVVALVVVLVLYLDTCPPVIWMGKNEYGRVEIWRTGCGWVKKGAKKGFQNHRYC